jgi:hypothetical protein
MFRSEPPRINPDGPVQLPVVLFPQAVTAKAANSPPVSLLGLGLHPSSATFWALIDRWRVSDEQALELISYEGKLTTGRPRFRLSAKQASIVTALLEIDSALAAAGINPAWLHEPSDQMPRSPLDLMRAGAMDEVLRSLTQATLQASVARAGKPKRAATKEPPVR